VIVTAEKMAERRYGVVRSWHGLGGGPTVLRIDWGGENNEKSSGDLPSRLRIATKRILATTSTDNEFASFSTPKILEDVITDHGLISDGRLSILTFREP
jgi:hypothetical protein